MKGFLRLSSTTRGALQATLTIVAMLSMFLIGISTSRHAVEGDSKLEPEGRSGRHARAAEERPPPPRSGNQSNRQDVRTRTPKPDGAVYIRWGRSTCPSEAAMVYRGVIGSGSSTEKGAGVSYICLTAEPEFDDVIAGSQSYGKIYGTEFMAHASLFSTDNMPSLANQDAACVACLSIRNTQIMIPGRKSCPAEWTREYHGMLMSSKFNEFSKEYICVDKHAEADRGGVRADGGAKLWPVEAQCGALPCPPYDNYKELTCVIMIPGRKSCPSAWAREYHGMLMGSRYNETSGRKYICVDKHAEADRGGVRADGGAKLWPVEAQCGALPCPPYDNYKELTCVVCTR